MKILTFKPPENTPANQDGRLAKPGQSIDFESFLNDTSKTNLQSPKGPRPNGVVDKITSENLLASRGAQVADVGAAGSLLNTLVGQIKASQTEALQNVHNLEGILYYYNL